MPNPTAADIEKLCDDWCAASIPKEGDLMIGLQSEQFRLLANDVVFHELDHETLCIALISLSKVLLHPGLTSVVDYDHFAIWSWCGQLILSRRTGFFSYEQREIKSLYETCIHAALVGCRRPVSSKDEFREQSRIRALQPHHAKQLLEQSSLVLTYLTFPLLEAVLKRACAAYVAFDGQVVASFSVPSRQGAAKTYGPAGSPGSSRCSSLRDLLFLYNEVIASPYHQLLMGRFRDHLTTLDVTQDPFDLIYGWRNQSLHGSTNYHTIGGTILSLALLISIFELEHEFEVHRSETVDICRWEEQQPSKSPWSFYPPY